MRRTRTEPRVVEPDLDAVAVQTNHELLPGPHAKSFAVARERSLGVGDKTCGLLFDLAPRAALGVKLIERQERVAVGVELGEDSPLDVVELRARAREAPPARPVREDAVVEGVRGPHSASLERRRDVVDPCRESSLRPVHRIPTLPHVNATESRHPPAVFVLYRRSKLRADALLEPVGAGARYSLYGLDELAAAGFAVAHNLEPGREAGAASRAAGAVLDRIVRASGGYSGDFATVLACRRQLNDADVVFSTVDTVGIPLTLLAGRGLVRTPIVYAAIGLPERLAQLRSARAQRMFVDAYRRLHTIVAYGAGEVDALRDWLGESGPSVVFVPFGVDTTYFAPQPDAARRHGRRLDRSRSRAGTTRSSSRSRERIPSGPAGSFSRATWPGHSGPSRRTSPSRWTFHSTGSASGSRAHASSSLPVRDNSYSGATTVLLQAMATARPVVVSRDRRDRDRIPPRGRRQLPPRSTREPRGAGGGRQRGSRRTTTQAASLGLRARETVERHLTWSRYTESISALLVAAARPGVTA